jgi:tetratricopeptide (TPR) repeat protein
VTQTAGALGRRRFYAWTGIVILILWIVLAGGGGSAGTHVPLFRIATQLFLAVVIGIWAIIAWRRPHLGPATTMWPVIVGVIVAFALSTVWSWNLRLSIEFLAYSVLLMTLYLLLVRLLTDPALRPRVLSLAAMLAGFIALLYTWTIVGHWISWWDAVGRITTPPLRPGFEGLSYGNPSAVAAIVVLFLAPAIAWLAPQRRGAIVIAILTALAAVTVVLSGSRGAWLAIGLAVVVTVLLLLATPRARRMIWRRLQSVPRVAIVGVVAVAAIAAVAVGPAILRRFAGGGDELRVTLNLTALRMFAEDPLTGSGPGTWVVRRAAFTEPQEVDYYIPHAHNVFTQGLAEFGLVGIVVGLITAVFVGRLLLDAVRGTDPDRQRVAWVAVFTLTYFAGHQLVDSYMNMPSILFAAVLPIAYLDATALTTREAASSRRSLVTLAESRAGFAILALACAVSLGWLARTDMVALTSLSAAAAAIDEDDAGAASLAREALAGDPDLIAYWFQAGLATATEDGTDGEGALDLMRRSAEADDFPQAWLNVAAIEAARGDHEAAREALAAAMRLGWQQPAVSFPAGHLYVQLGMDEPAIEAFAQALLLAPELGDDPFWQSDPAVSAVHDGAVDRALSLAHPSVAPFVAMYGGRAKDARSLAQQLPGAEGQIASLAIDAWLGDDAAQAALVDLAEANPLDTRPAVWSSLLASRDGDDTARARFARWAGLVGGSLGTATGTDVVVTDKPWNRRQVAGPNANFQGLYTYRRLYPWDLLVPGVPKLTLE